MSEGDIHLSFDVTADNMRAFADAITELTSEAVMAGFPADEKPREDEEGNPSLITNAALGYIHNTGVPELNIPARPFMVEGIESKQTQIVTALEQTGIAALDGDRDATKAGLDSVGMLAQAGIRQKIVDGPFVPLKESTLRGRVQMGGDIGTAAAAELASRRAGNAPNPDNVRPLNATGQMRNAVNYVIRKDE